MKPEELMQPRYKVIADYPHSPFTVGMIMDKWNSISPDMNNYEKYPNIFRRLEWWEDRDEKDMPEYFKWTSANSGKLYVAKLINYNGEYFTAQLPDGYIIKQDFYSGQDLPATEEEFIIHNKQKNH